jgi:hypothetical protein
MRKREEYSIFIFHDRRSGNATDPDERKEPGVAFSVDH